MKITNEYIVSNYRQADMLRIERSSFLLIVGRDNTLRRVIEIETGDHLNEGMKGLTRGVQ